MAHSVPLPPNKTRRGFTLIEILVVVAIVAILAAASYPAMKGMIARSHQAKCLSNLQQLGVATAMYVQENDQTFPALNFFFKDLGPYLNYQWAGASLFYNLPDSRNPFFCPASTPYKSTLAAGYNGQLSYGINAQTVAGKKIWDLQADSRRKLSATLLYADSTAPNIWRDNPERVPLNWHDGSVSVLFADYHAEPVRIKSASSPEWHSLIFGFPQS